MAPAAVMAPPSLKRKAAGSAAPAPRPAPARPGPSVPAPAAATADGAPPALDGDEYDPLRPNDYAEVLRKRHEDFEAAQEACFRAREEILGRRLPPAAPAAAPAAEAGPGPGEPAGRGGLGLGAAGVAGLGPGSADGAGADAAGAAKAGGTGGLTAAQRMMQKMGWKRGEGLGKHRQGMATPLEARATAGGGHAVIGSAELEGGLAGAADPTARSGDPAATRVVLLRNMVGPGEVDDELEDEVADECESKYGAVTRVVIFEVTGAACPPEEAVRIFVEFQGSAAAERALRDLGGRFFGGREVRAGYFDEARYARQEFGPLPGEIPGA